MKKLLFVLIGMLTFGISQVDAQTTEKVEKKVIIKKKKVDKDGKEVVEVIEAEGKEAEELIQKMKEDGEMGDIEIEMDVEEGKTVKKVKKKHSMHKEHKVLHKSHGDEKMIKVSVDSKGEKDGENVFVIKVDDGDGEKVIEWTGDEGEYPVEMKEFMKEGNMKIKMSEDPEGEGMMIVSVERDDDNIPEVNVRMGIELTNLEGTLEVDNVQEGSPAHTAGFMKGDLVTEINGYHIAGYAGLMDHLAKHKPGDKVDVRVIRDGKAQIISLTLASKE